MAQSLIEWTDLTWNPVTGCNKISPGCKHCYAEKMAHRLQAMQMKMYQKGFDVACHYHELAKPFDWKKPQMVFVNSMGDLFHDNVSLKFIQAVFTVMSQTRQHTYQVLTKRSERLREFSSHLRWEENIWMGVSVESNDYLFRIDDLRQTGAHIKFLSLEPLLGPLPQLDLTGIHWVIVGGESGPGARPMAEEWVSDIRNQCVAAQVPFFFKQWGGVNKKKSGRILEGREWNQYPTIIETCS